MLERNIGKYNLAVWKGKDRWGWSIQVARKKWTTEVAYGYQPTCRKAKLAAMRKLSSMKRKAKLAAMRKLSSMKLSGEIE